MQYLFYQSSAVIKRPAEIYLENAH